MSEFIRECSAGQITGGMLAVFFVFTVGVQISPVKINPWSWAAKKIGKAINGEVIGKVESLDQKVESMRCTNDERYAIDCRSRILRFGDELLHDTLHTKEHFDQILRDVKFYEEYCAAHPEFENNTTVLTTKKIEECYQTCWDKHSFL